MRIRGGFACPWDLTPVWFRQQCKSTPFRDTNTHFFRKTEEHYITQQYRWTPQSTLRCTDCDFGKPQFTHKGFELVSPYRCREESFRSVSFASSCTQPHCCTQLQDGTPTRGWALWHVGAVVLGKAESFGDRPHGGLACRCSCFWQQCYMPLVSSTRLSASSPPSTHRTRRTRRTQRAQHMTRQTRKHPPDPPDPQTDRPDPPDRPDPCPGGGEARGDGH